MLTRAKEDKNGMLQNQESLNMSYLERFRQGSPYSLKAIDRRIGLGIFVKKAKIHQLLTINSPNMISVSRHCPSICHAKTPGEGERQNSGQNWTRAVEDT